ncbi:hypothetical protein [Glaciimonas soli]|uniref:Proline-rich region n=1 Tax=Glaciimonas soli TaxID=2590999 RepID=A0A843YT48_9BURK|nr:hypothetical protein [Glaciimonas soli]MQR01167.1 hypothetical protein [Glaciimonas soli]
MKKFIVLALTAVSLLVASGASNAWGYYGHGGYYGPRVGVGISIGGPLYVGPGPYYGYGYGYPYPYYPPATVVVQPQEQAYIERSDNVAPAAAAVQYYCPSPAGYYPQIPRCPKGWQKIVPDNNYPPQ